MVQRRAALPGWGCLCLVEKMGEFGWRDFGLAGVDFEEDRGVLLEDFAVGAGGDIRVVGEVVEDNAGAVETSGANALEREPGVVDAAEAVGHDKDDRQGKSGGEVGDGFFGRDWNEPTSGAFDEEGWVFLREVAEPGFQRVECDGAILK